MHPVGPVKQPIVLLQERADDGDATRRQTQRRGYQPVVSPRSNRRRNDIERLLRRPKG